MTLTLDQNPIVALNSLLIMKESEFLTVSAIQWWVRQVDYGKYQEAFPSIPSIAKVAGISEKSVERCLKKYRNILFEYDTGRFSRSSNKYRMFDGCFDAIEYLRAKGYIQNFKKHKNWLQEKFQIEADFYEQRDRLKVKLSTMKCRTYLDPKCRSIKNPSSKDVSYRESLKIRTEGSTQSYEQKPKKQPLKFGKAYMFLKEVGVSDDEAKKIDRTSKLPDQAWFESRNDFRWFEKRQTIYNPAAFMISRAKEHTRKMYRL